MKALSLSKGEPVSSMIHLVGSFGFLTYGCIFVFISQKSEIVAIQFYATLFFLFSLVLLLATSSCYHIIAKDCPKKIILRKADQSLIFIVIATTNTPICILVNNKASYTLLLTVWLIAMIGCLVKIFDIKIKNFIFTLLYIILGLLVLTINTDIKALNPVTNAQWLYWGGFFYIFGCVFYLLGKHFTINSKFGYHEIWHLFVLAGNFSHAYLITKYVIG